MIEFKNYLDVPEDFTGICKFLADNSICYFKNGKFHREDGPAIQYENGNKYWYINGLHHREDGPASEHSNGAKYWYYKNKCYGCDNFTIKSWEEKVRELKMEIFK